jgi:hypothetical protein
MSLFDYIEGQRMNLDTIRESPYFSQLCFLTDRLYRVGIRLLREDTPVTFGKLVLLSHKSFLAAATLIAQAQPDDAAPITRRAIEIARLALALKADPENAKRWVAAEARQQRWQERHEGKRPSRVLNIQYKNLPQNQHLDRLNRLFGILSDSKVHFTPEYFGMQDWRIELHGEKGSLFHSYFDGDKRSIDSAFLLLNSVHLLVLRVFDDCLDQAFSSDKGWQLDIATFGQVSLELARQHQKGAPTESAPGGRDQHNILEHE